MKVCIAEKPSVAKEIALILGANSRRDGYYEGNNYQVTWTFGHFCTLKAPEDYTPQWRKWQMNYLPMIPQRFSIKLIENDGVEKQFNVIKTLIDKCDEVINCGDAGIEGELIQRWVLQKAQCKVPVKRLWISSLTEEAIREGFKNLKEASKYDNLYAAGSARAIGDWLLGMNASRLYTLKYSNGKGVLSIGRVQTPTLALIVNRHKEIENFKPEIFWELKTIYRETAFASTKGRFESIESANQVIEAIKESEFEILSFTKKKGKEAPPKLFDLTALQVECNNKFNFTAEDTLKYIQQLYEAKLVTYPRVDTTYLPTDMYAKIPDILKKMTPYQQFTEPLLKTKIKKSTKVFDDKKITDHHAIIPTGEYPSALSHQQKQVYDSIARRFLAAFHPDCIVSNTTVMGEAAKYEFKATGKEILEDGWRILYPKKQNVNQNQANSEELQLMPTFVKGEKGPHTPEATEKQTSPPKYYTEASLLRAMETAGKQIDDEELRDALKENGIGRPSTRANVIETLFKRRFVTRLRKNLIPTITGIQLIDTITNDLLKSVELTGLWERKLREIEKGEYQVTLFMGEMKQLVTEIVNEVKQGKNKTIVIEEEVKQEEPEKDSSKAKNKKSSDKETKNEEIICPKCKNGKIKQGKTAFGCSLYNKSCDFKLDFTLFGKKLTEKQSEEIISKGKSRIIKGFELDGKKIEAFIELDKNFLPQLIEHTKTETKETKLVIEDLVCPKCGKGKMLKGKMAYGCSEYKTGCKTVISFTDLKEKFKTEVLTKAILKQIF